MQFLILNGTLCTPSLWSPFCESIQKTMGNIIKTEKDFFTFPDITTGDPISELATKVGDALQKNEKPTWVLGYSLGGIIALELMRNYQDVVQGLILVCSNANGQTKEKQEGLEKQRAYVQSYGLENLFDEILLPLYFGETLEKNTHLAETIKCAGMELGETVLLRQLQSLETRSDQIPNLHKINTPTLLVYGEHDPLCTPSQNQRMHEKFPQSTAREYKNTGHMLPFLQSEKLTQDVVAFMKATKN